MEVSFDDLKYLVTVVADDLLNDDFSNFKNCESLESNVLKSEISDEMYDKVRLLSDLLNELYKHRPLSF